MKDFSMKKYKFFLACSALVFSMLIKSVCFAETIPSCHDDVALKNDKPGTSPACTPLILTTAASVDLLKRFSVKKIKRKWYIFLSEKEFTGEFDTATRWQTISLLVAAVQSLYNDRADCYIARIPKNDKEKEALLSGNYPQKLIAAQGEYLIPEHEVEESDWPEYHHRFLYKLAVN